MLFVRLSNLYYYSYIDLYSCCLLPTVYLLLSETYYIDNDSLRSS